jgi:hypothetical protein
MTSYAKKKRAKGAAKRLACNRQSRFGAMALTPYTVWDLDIRKRPLHELHCYELLYLIAYLEPNAQYVCIVAFASLIMCGKHEWQLCQIQNASWFLASLRTIAKEKGRTHVYCGCQVILHLCDCNPLCVECQHIDIFRVQPEW